MSKRIAVAFAICAASTSAAGASARSQGACEALARQSLQHVTITVADSIGGGSFAAPDGTRHQTPAFCRVHGEARPTAGSRINFELWMPADGWNGRYYQLGNGGFAGGIHYPSLAAELKRGNAVAITDTGHVGGSFDASWAHGQPQKIIDYGYRSLIETATAAKNLIRAYYGESPRHRYFAGCSNGGRQALMLAQRQPQDWDGILAGAPAYDWTSQLIRFASAQHALRSRPESWIAPAKLAAIQRAAIESCTPAARVWEGIPADPRQCHFDPQRLLCKQEETDQCLTRAQIEALSEIVAEPHGFEATAAGVTGNWDRWIVNPDRAADTQLTLAEHFFRHVVLDDADWTIERFTSRDAALAQSKPIAGESLSHVLDATNTDLTAFATRGAKLLMYFGWADALISPHAAVHYYDRVARRMGGLDKTQTFFRLFMVPGMTHCQGGPGANAFGQSYLTPGLRDDARHDMRRALEAWVERAAAPQTIVATKYVNDDAERGVATTRTLCAFPLVSEYRGASGADRAADFSCAGVQ